jgi:hypothetical protein
MTVCYKQRKQTKQQSVTPFPCVSQFSCQRDMSDVNNLRGGKVHLLMISVGPGQSCLTLCLSRTSWQQSMYSSPHGAQEAKS